MSDANDVDRGAVTVLLMAWRDGDEQARDRLVQVVYDELHRLAHHYRAGEGSKGSLQTTELVHEAYLRLVDSRVDWRGRRHFFGIAARSMRQILVDRARRARAAKRGGGEADLPLLEPDLARFPARDLVDLDDALAGLAVVDKRKAKVVDLHYFAGLTIPETARLMALSTATVERDLRVAKAWLAQEMGADGN